MQMICIPDIPLNALPPQRLPTFSKGREPWWGLVPSYNDEREGTNRCGEYIGNIEREREGTAVGNDSLGTMYLYQVLGMLVDYGLKRGRAKSWSVPL